MTECPTPTQLEKLINDELSDEEAERLVAHIERCDACGRNIREHQASEAYLKRVKAALNEEDGPLGQTTRSASATLTADGAVPLRSATPAVRADNIPGYELLREISRGGQGVVYEAVQASTKRTVAIKMMLRGPFADETSRARFQREVELVAALKHPNIVVIHDSGIAHGGHYFVMDLIDGRRLDEYARSASRSVREVVELFTLICNAISFAHRHGVIHRDLKPSNILVGEEGTPYVLDFGLAKSIAEEVHAGEQQPTLSEPGHIMGTLRYMSPEQTQGDPAAIDTRTDVYSLGVILYELLSGTAPYETRTDIMTALANIREAVPPRPSKHNRRINSELAAIILHAIEKEPDRRYQSAGELVQDLNAWLEGKTVIAKSSSSLYVIRKIAQRHALVTTVLSSVLLIILSFSAIAGEFYLRAESAEEQRGKSDLGATLSELKAAGYQEATFTAIRRTALGWFLAAWHAQHFEEARRYQVTVRQDSPEYLAMAFLLDDTYTAEQLRRDLPRDEAPLVYLAIGERHLQSGQTDAARESLEVAYDMARGDLLMQAFIGTRLKEIRAAIGNGTAGSER